MPDTDPADSHTSLPDLDSTFVRSQFPAFGEPSLDGWAFFENAGGSYACRQTIERLTSYYRRTKVQPYYGFPASREAGAAMDDSYRRFAAWLGVEEHEMHFGPSTTQNVDILARALRSLWQDGDEIVVSNQDHEANAGAWRRLESTGIVVREWEIDPQTGHLPIEALEEMVNERTRLVAFPHCSNIVGEINPVREVVDTMAARDAVVVVDGVSYAPHGLPDVGALGVDVYLFSLYKTWGPHLGAMTVRRELMDRLPGQGHFFNADDPRKKLLVAGPDHAQIAAAAGVIDYLEAVFSHHFPDSGAEPGSAESGRQVHDLFRRHETALLEPLLTFLKDNDAVRVLGPLGVQRRAPTVSVVPRSIGVEQLFDGLTDRRVMVGVGDFYGVRPLQAMGVPIDPGVVRLSFVHYTTEGEVRQLTTALEEALSTDRSGR